ncbi:hypothetical protein LguiB_033923 [Lonicera macranthoides]
MGSDLHRPKPKHAFLFLTLLLLSSPLPSDSLFFTPYQTLFSLSHSLITRVANLRASRGDHSGAARAKMVAEKLERGRGLGLWGFMGSMGWDYARNYAWGDFASFEMYGAVKDVNELMRHINELTRMDSEGSRVDWVRRNYGNVLRVLKSLFTRLLQVFRKPGPLRELMENLQREVVEGDLLRDCLEIGSNDLKGLTQIFRDVILQFSSSYSAHNSEL